MIRESCKNCSARNAGGGCLRIVPLFAERIGEPREPLAPLAKGAVLALDVRRSRTVQVGIAADGILGDRYKLGWHVALGYVVKSSREQLHYLTMIRAVVQARVDGRLVGFEAVRAHIEPARRGCPP